MSERPTDPLGRIAAALEMIETYIGMLCKGQVVVEQVGNVKKTTVTNEEQLTPADKPKKRPPAKKKDVPPTPPPSETIEMDAEKVIALPKPPKPVEFSFELLKQGGIRYQRLFGRPALIELIQSYSVDKISQIPKESQEEFWDVCWSNPEPERDEAEDMMS